MIPQRSSKKRAAQHIAIYSAGTIIRQLAGFIMLPIYTSYLTPADYGVVGLLIVMVGLFEILIGARFAQSVPRFYYEEEDLHKKKSVVTTALFVTAAVSFISASLVYLFSESISTVLFGSSDFQSYVAVYGSILLTGAIEVYGLTYFRIQERPFLFILNSICKLILQLTLNIIFIVHWEMGVSGVVYSSVISSFVFSLVSLFYILKNNGLYFSSPLVVRLFKFSWPLWLAGLAGLYIGSSNRFFIRIFSDLDQVGLFELATKFSAILPMLIWKPFSQWWQTEKFKIFNEPGRGKDVFPSIFNGVSAVLLLAATVVIILSSPTIRIMSSNAFYPAVQAIPMLVYSAMFGELTNFFLFSFLVKDKTLIITYIKYLSAALITILYFLMIPHFGYVGASYALLISSIFSFFVSYFWSIRHFDNGIRVRFLMGLLSISLIVVTFDALYLNKIDSMIHVLIYKVILISVATLAFFWLSKKDSYLRKPLIELFRFLVKKKHSTL